MNFMINFLISAVIWYYSARAVSYAVYTFRDRNIAGGISVIILAMLTLASSAVFIIDIFK